MTTTLPAPSADALSAGGRWPHMPALRTELRALVADLNPIHTTRGPDAMTQAESLKRRSYQRLTVGVYTPLGRDEVHLGWLLEPALSEAVARLIAHLPGSRLAQNPPHSWLRTVEWGSRTPGWTPTALRVDRNAGERTWRERDQLWTAQQIQEHIGINTSTWRSYVARRDAGAPIALGTIREVDHLGITRTLSVWECDTVLAWHAGRPGKGGRPRKIVDPS